MVGLRVVKKDERAGDTFAPQASLIHYVTIHGYRRAYRMVGSGPVLVLLHGIGDNSGNWLEAIADLARDHTVIAPDLLGHGRSDKPRADYSLAAYANGLRDLLDVLGIERATFVGHSLGGGVAMQFAYQFPKRVERLVLVGAGGAGPEVATFLRLLSTPLAAAVLVPLRLPFARTQLRVAMNLLHKMPADLGLDALELLRVMDGFLTADSRSAFLRTLRAVVDWRGQVVTMLDRCYLTENVPTMIVWGDRDGVIPISHAERAHLAMPDSRLEIFHGAGHFPHRSEPERFLKLVREFVASTPPASWDQVRRREQLIAGRPERIKGITTFHDLPIEDAAAHERSAT